MKKYIFLSLLLIIITIPFYVNAVSLAEIFNRAINGGGATPNGYDTKNVLTTTKDRQLLGLDNNAKQYLQTKTNKDSSHIKGLNTEFANRLAAFIKAGESAGQRIIIYSGYRNPAYQQILKDRAIARGRSHMVGSPGGIVNGVCKGSRHNCGLAADLMFNGQSGVRTMSACFANSACKWAHQNAGGFGLVFRLNGKGGMPLEPWHIEPGGAVSMDSNSADVQKTSPDSNNTQSTAKKAEDIGKKISGNPSTASPGGQEQGANIIQGDPYSIWGDSAAATTTTQSDVASISCTPGEVSGAERSLIEWGCSGPSTRSRGGTTQIQSLFDTKGSLNGKGYARPMTTTGYKVQCLIGDRVIDEATCKVNVSQATASTVTQVEKPILHISPKLPGVAQGERTDVRWVTIGASNCVLQSGGEEVGRGESGSIDTGRLFSATAYLLKCDTNEGSKSVKAEVKVI